MAYSLWFVGCGLRFMVLRFMIYGLWFVVYGSWLWFAVYGFWSVADYVQNAPCA